ncbi:hypothetical protein S40285_09932 [Stachybotrys chlorohalonatus IBT 40285]|uniref:Secreted protein n=1 Tax=Stachybotrys chlorohalonatus (strain IBT 40285) TaxID=1283841 RepID=A0A084QHG1_STAC4|nr:hypothetical protein S40285_09932 [Stachybotrys chlorohalonata IBT 40285]
MNLSFLLCPALLLAVAAWDWQVEIYESDDCDNTSRQYYVEGVGDLSFMAWMGPPWEGKGKMETCYYFHDGQAPLPCNGINKSFEPRSIRTWNGNCTANSWNPNEPFQFLENSTPADRFNCNERMSNWEYIHCQ